MKHAWLIIPLIMILLCIVYMLYINLYVMPVLIIISQVIVIYIKMKNKRNQ